MELQHVIVTDRQLNEITEFCLRKILNVTLHEATRSKENSRTRCVGNHNKERMTAVLVMCNARRTPEEQNRHCNGFLMRTEIEVDHVLHGNIQTVTVTVTVKFY